VISQIASHPSFFLEARRVFHSGETAFVTKAIPYTLPLLFITRNQPALGKIAAIKGEYIYEIAKDFIHDILAECYLLPDEEDAECAIDFALHLFSSDYAKKMELQTVLSTYLHSIVISLIIVAGEDHSSRLDAVSVDVVVVIRGY
jgi:hypothetical protein